MGQDIRPWYHALAHPTSQCDFNSDTSWLGGRGDHHCMMTKEQGMNEDTKAGRRRVATGDTIGHVLGLIRISHCLMIGTVIMLPLGYSPQTKAKVGWQSVTTKVKAQELGLSDCTTAHLASLHQTHVQELPGWVAGSAVRVHMTEIDKMSGSQGRPHRCYVHLWYTIHYQANCGC